MRASAVPGLLAALCAALLLHSPAPCAAGEPAGVVRTLSGEVSVLRSGGTLPASPGMKILAGDRLVTGADGALGVLLRDNSALSLGHDSEVEISRFLFSPAEGELGLSARIFRGTVAYLSGLIARLSPESVKFETPEASIGIRGTHFAAQVAPPP